MNKETKLVSAMAQGFMRLGFEPPRYKRPKWYQFRLRRLLAYYRRHGWPYTLED